MTKRWWKNIKTRQTDSKQPKPAQPKNCRKWPQIESNLYCLGFFEDVGWLILALPASQNPSSQSPDGPHPLTHLFHQLNEGTSHAAWCWLCSHDLTCLLVTCETHVIKTFFSASSCLCFCIWILPVCALHSVREYLWPLLFVYVEFTAPNISPFKKWPHLFLAEFAALLAKGYICE